MRNDANEAVAVRLPETAAGAYEVWIEAGVLDRMSELLDGRASADRWALITDDTVAELHGRRVLDALRRAGRTAELLTIPPGEAEKTRAQWGRLTDAMVEAGFGRDAGVLALGGGVVGDLAGFVAATYMRGVPCVQVPTTLLAMIDASVGGKTGVDTPGGKNLVGVIRQPVLVVADPGVLRTLPLASYRAGLAEAVKHGVIADAAYLDWIERSAAYLLDRSPDAVAQLVRRSVEIKASFVVRDAEEHGPRKALNFGHTIGHAVESLSGYALAHGEAVAIGMVAEARLGEAVGVTERGTAERIAAVLGALGLPTGLPEGLEPRRIVEQARRDKKARRGTTRYALVRALGEIARSELGDWAVPMDEGRVERVLRGGDDV